MTCSMRIRLSDGLDGSDVFKGWPYYSRNGAGCTNVLKGCRGCLCWGFHVGRTGLGDIDVLEGCPLCTVYHRTVFPWCDV
jgi:hypothetical protein